MKTKQQSGFTLVELVMVIVLIGILAAIAVPRFVSLSGDARKATVEGFAGGVKAAAVVAQAAWLAKGGAVSSISTADGQTVSVSSVQGLPLGTSAGIGVAMRCADTACDTFAATYGATTAFELSSAPTPASCKVSYTASDGTVSVTTSGC